MLKGWYGAEYYPGDGDTHAKLIDERTLFIWKRYRVVYTKNGDIENGILGDMLSKSFFTFYFAMKFLNKAKCGRV